MKTCQKHKDFVQALQKSKLWHNYTTGTFRNSGGGMGQSNLTLSLFKLLLVRDSLNSIMVEEKEEEKK